MNVMEISVPQQIDGDLLYQTYLIGAEENETTGGNRDFIVYANLLTALNGKVADGIMELVKYLIPPDGLEVPQVSIAEHRDGLCLLWIGEFWSADVGISFNVDSLSNIVQISQYDPWGII